MHFEAKDIHIRYLPGGLIIKYIPGENNFWLTDRENTFDTVTFNFSAELSQVLGVFLKLLKMDTFDYEAYVAQFDWEAEINPARLVGVLNKAFNFIQRDGGTWSNNQEICQVPEFLDKV